MWDKSSKYGSTTTTLHLSFPSTTASRLRDLVECVSFIEE